MSGRLCQAFPAQYLQWVETNPSNICIFPTDIDFLLPRGTTLKALIRMLIQMFADIRQVGFLPPVYLYNREIFSQLFKNKINGCFRSRTGCRDNLKPLLCGWFYKTCLGCNLLFGIISWRVFLTLAKQLCARLTCSRQSVFPDIFNRYQTGIKMTDYLAKFKLNLLKVLQQQAPWLILYILHP